MHSFRCIVDYLEEMNAGSVFCVLKMLLFNMTWLCVWFDSVWLRTEPLNAFSATVHNVLSPVGLVASFPIGTRF